jgi:hypothetical protein
MIQRVRSLLLIVASASLIANGAHWVTGANAASATGVVDPGSISYIREGGDVSAIAFQLATSGKRVQVRVSANDVWHGCSTAGTAVHCAIPPRPVTDVNRLEIQTM